MIPKSCQRLAEVDFPIAEVSRRALEDKRVRSGHPASMHIWWARRPLASSRAVLLGLLLPDPCDPVCPRKFKEQARALLRQVASCNPGTTDEDLRKALFRFISDFSSWGLAANHAYLEVSRGLVKAAHGDEVPLVVDPFAGGGSIPLEALRIGCDAYASDLNPVAYMILRMVLDNDLGSIDSVIAEFEAHSELVMKQIRAILDQYYPSEPKKETVGYFWARTVQCESPACGAEIPLLKSFWLSSARATKAALLYRIIRKPKKVPALEFEIFEPKRAAEVPGASVSRAKARCPCCETVLAPDRVRAQLRERHGGTDVIFDSNGHRTGGARLMAVAENHLGSQHRRFRLPTIEDYKAVHAAHQQLKKICASAAPGDIGVVPNEPVQRVPVPFGVINVWLYGMETWGDLFSARQALALSTIVQVIRSMSDRCSPKVQTLFGFALSIFARTCNGNARLRPDGSAAPAFGMQALPFTWAFPESIPWGSRAETFAGAIETLLSVLRGPALRVPTRAQVECSDARKSLLPDESAAVWFTDPPYYDAIPYSYLSDFFYVWLKRSIGPIYPGVFVGQLTPKDNEIVSYRIPDSNEAPRQRFERMMGEAFAEGRRILNESGIGSVVFAHKTTEGWEALLSGIVGSGWTVTASWPIATEAANRLRARNAAALATSVHLICRPRPNNAPIGDWAGVLRELPKRVGYWMERLQGEGVRGADLVFACIGPALEVFSRYTKVETADGREVGLPQYLEKVWEVVGRSALGQVLGTSEAKARNGAVGAVEEDARLTALFLWTLQSTNGEGVEDADDESEEEESPDDEDNDEEESSGKVKGFTLIHDVVRRFAQPLGIELPKWEGRVIETKKGVVRLLPIAERAKQLFGEDGAQAVATRLEREAVLGPNPLQGMLFPEMEAAPTVRGRAVRSRSGRMGEVSDQSHAAAREATTLDRVHAAMLLQASGRTNALRALLKAEQERGPDFLRLANALSALYPKGSEEKRLLEAMLLAIPR
jgi:putative DNA methylase